MNIPKSYKMIGLMSGTSGDGLDMTYCEFTKEEEWSFQIIKSQTIPFPPSLEESLALAHRFAGEELAHLDILFGKWMGQNVRAFCESNGFFPQAIASHGHTVFHQPDRGLTLQIGNGWAIHQASRLPVINDFRSLDVMLGGQGAPLVPIGDRHLFGQYDFCLNLGGIANVSFETSQGRRAMDISPFNLLLNRYARKKGSKYDDEGKWAEQGVAIPELLNSLDNLPLYHPHEPKSLGREDIENFYLPLLDKYHAPPENILSSLVAHFSKLISGSILRNSEKTEPATLLITGGGAYNSYFLKLLKESCGEKITPIIPEQEIIDFKEALIFAFLGVLRWRNEVNCLSTVTGASKDNSGGTIYGF